MADDIDTSNDNQQKHTDIHIANIRKQAQLPKGVKGDCDLCGEWSGRLITGICAPCRDLHQVA
ncbi:hypothetical protein [Marinagarivorans algicola]|uniref:hypothetical protein n=1 Tax=Marinagarivorans algicola TaxID=1513270 RepID=UPI0006B61E17|nr:hypothetical protein [Marinagarivorans algicola]